MCLCAGLVFLAAGLCIWVEPASAGSGIPDMKGYLNGTNIKDALTFNALVCKVLGLICAVGGGLCVCRVHAQNSITVDTYIPL